MRVHIPSLILGMAIVIAAIAVVGWRGQVVAEDWLLGAGASYHFERRGQNERHLGLGFERRFSEEWRNWSAAIAFIDNSSNRLSIDAVGAYTPWQYDRARWGVMGGLATGYRDKPLEPIIIGGFAGAVEWKTFGLNGVLIPTKVFFLQLKWRLD
jgi:hypothetical protein